MWPTLRLQALLSLTPGTKGYEIVKVRMPRSLPPKVAHGRHFLERALSRLDLTPGAPCSRAAPQARRTSASPVRRTEVRAQRTLEPTPTPVLFARDERDALPAIIPGLAESSRRAAGGAGCAESTIRALIGFPSVVGRGGRAIYRPGVMHLRSRSRHICHAETCRDVFWNLVLRVGKKMICFS